MQGLLHNFFHAPYSTAGLRSPLGVWVVIPILFFFFHGYNAYAVGLEATVDKTEATLEDQIILTVSVSGLRGLKQRPELPPLPEFGVTEGSTSSRTEIINGQFSSSVDFTYALSPRRAGKFTIGPVTMTIRGEIYKSTPVVVTILSAEHPAEERAYAYITQEIDTTTPYVNQQIIYTFRFLSRVQTVDARLQPPSFQGFWAEDLGKERHYQRVIGGIPYSVTEIRKALFPMNTGPSDIEESLLTCKLLAPQKRSRRSDSPFDDSFFSNPFFQMEESVTKTLHSEPIHLEVRPLPKEGRPQDFRGLVGDFRIHAELGQNQLRAGDSTTLTITVQGRGNLRDLTDVSMENLASIKIYPDNPSFQMKQVGDFIEGTKVFKKALVPLQEGPLEIPPLKVVYFEPVSAAYKVAKTEALKLSVLKAPEKEGLRMVEALSPVGQKITVQSLGEDLSPIHTALSAASSTVASAGSIWIAAGMFLVPPLAFFSSLGIKRRKDRLELDRSYARRKEAGRNARRELSHAKRSIAAEENREFYRELSRCIKGFVGDKENVSALALTPLEIDQKLKASGLKAELSQAVRELLEELEYCHYVTSQKTVGEREALFRKTKNILAQLNKKL